MAIPGAASRSSIPLSSGTHDPEANEESASGSASASVSGSLDLSYAADHGSSPMAISLNNLSSLSLLSLDALEGAFLSIVLVSLEVTLSSFGASVVTQEVESFSATAESPEEFYLIFKT